MISTRTLDGNARRVSVPQLHKLGTAAATAVLLSAAASAQPSNSWQDAVSIDPEGLQGINSGALEGCPMESHDGQTLFFATDREASQHGLDIWIAQRRSGNEPWGEPERLPEPVNSNANDFCPTPLPGGGLMFVSNRTGGCGPGADIYQTRLHPVRGWLEPEHLGCAFDATGINSGGNEFSPSLVQADGQTQLYFSSDRENIQQLYVSVRQSDGSWGAPEPVHELNGGFDAWRPNVRRDGRAIVFDSLRGSGFQQIWISTRRNVNASWSPPMRMGEEINDPGADQARASFSWDGRRLYFGSNRSGGQGSSDIYVAIRKNAAGR